MNGTSNGLIRRALGAALLDIPTYEAVEADRSATGQAAMVVFLVAVSGAIGASGEGSQGMIASVFNAFSAWLIWAGVTNFVGTKVFGGTADWGELLRTLGFAQAPGLLAFLAILPVLGWSVSAVIGVWTLVTGVVAIRQALDFSTGKAVLTALLSMVVVIAVAVAFGILVGVSVGVGRLIGG